MGLLTTAYCDEKQKEFDVLWDAGSLEHDFLIRQATTINVNAATQLLTVTLVAIQDTSERLRDALTREICLVKQALEWGEDGTPPHHWDQLVAVRGSLCDLRHNLHTLFSYMDYAEKLATVAAEISYLSGNIAASDAICERIDHACRTCNAQKQLTHELQQESLELQQQAILSAPQELQDKLVHEAKKNEKKKLKT
uniref:Direct IAP-binding protein with low pI n=1 Tax=Heliothis virescens TaxID=7102 RepID=A0A2A4JCC9_HELVI